MCMLEDNPVVDMRAPCKVNVAAEAPRKIQDNVDEGLNILPPSLRKHYLESVSHNRGVLKKLAKM